MLWQIDDFGELTPPDQDTLSSSEDQIPGGRHGGIFEVQAILAKLPLLRMRASIQCPLRW